MVSIPGVPETDSQDEFPKLDVMGMSTSLLRFPSVPQAPAPR